jgi:hypothetical protein
LVFPRSLFGEVRKRAELQGTGVYVLWGLGESGQLPRVYVGEGDGVVSRLDQHARTKDFWTHAVVFTSKDQNLNKAHVQYLEASLVALASQAKRCELENGNVPKPSTLSEADIADAEGFLRDMLLCLPIVGVNVFERPQAISTKVGDLLLKAKGLVSGSGVYGPEGLVVRAGSTASRTEAPSIHPYLSGLRHTLADKGVLADDGQVYRLTQDYTFNSPSTAAGVLLGRTANGRTEWKDATGRTLKEIQEREAAG